MENVLDDHSQETALEMYENILTHIYIKNKQTTQRPTLNTTKHKTLQKNDFWNNSLMISFLTKPTHIGKKILTAKKNVILSLKNTIFRRLVKEVFGDYLLRSLNNSQVSILEQHLHHIIKFIF